MAISTNPKPTIYPNFHANTDPGPFIPRSGRNCACINSHIKAVDLPVGHMFMMYLIRGDGDLER